MIRKVSGTFMKRKIIGLVLAFSMAMAASGCSSKEDQRTTESTEAVITEAERDRFEELWDEREEIKNKTGEDGIYRDLVTQALEEAENTIIDLWTDEISEAEYLRKKLDKQKEKAEADYAEWKKKEDAAYKKIMGTTM